MTLIPLFHTQYDMLAKRSNDSLNMEGQVMDEPYLMKIDTRASLPGHMFFRRHLGRTSMLNDVLLELTMG